MSVLRIPLPDGPSVLALATSRRFWTLAAVWGGAYLLCRVLVHVSWVVGMLHWVGTPPDETIRNVAAASSRATRNLDVVAAASVIAAIEADGHPSRWSPDGRTISTRELRDGDRIMPMVWVSDAVEEASGGIEIPTVTISTADGRATGTTAYFRHWCWYLANETPRNPFVARLEFATVPQGPWVRFGNAPDEEICDQAEEPTRDAPEHNRQLLFRLADVERSADAAGRKSAEPETTPVGR